MKKTFYITTTTPYVNADPHIGFAMELIRADVLARYKRLEGYDVVFNTGTDEHGLKIYQQALLENKDPQRYCDEYSQKFKRLKPLLNVSFTNFIRTTDSYHVIAAQEFWNRCLQNNDIYKKKYKIKYCVGCELEKTDSELKENKCPIHPNKTLEIIEEENYFFRFSKYQQSLLNLYQKNLDFVTPGFRLKEIADFVAKGLQDFSISRLKSKMPWGIDVPNDPDHVMYVWFDALINYISTIGWPKDEKKFSSYWPCVQLAGKDNLRQQSAMWQAMLMSAKLAPSKQIFIGGFITSDGQKMSKSLGNVINPVKLVHEYSIDAVRYYLLREIPSYEDGDFSHSRMEEIYNTDLANELGNLVMRITTLSEKDYLEYEDIKPLIFEKSDHQLFEKFQFSKVLENIWNDVKALNKNINDYAPWKKSTHERKQFLLEILGNIRVIAFRLQPMLPSTAETILNNTKGLIKKSPPLFPKK